MKSASIWNDAVADSGVLHSWIFQKLLSIPQLRRVFEGLAWVLAGSHSLPASPLPALGGRGVEKLNVGLTYLNSFPK